MFVILLFCILLFIKFLYSNLKIPIKIEYWFLKKKSKRRKWTQRQYQKYQYFLPKT